MSGAACSDLAILAHTYDTLGEGTQLDTEGKTRIELVEKRPTALEVTTVAFRHLLDHGQPTSVGRLAARLGADPAAVEVRLQGQERAGRIRRNEVGEVTVAGGLSLEPTTHRVSFQGRDRFTCCAFDALGILGALGADGIIESISPSTGSPIRVSFLKGLPEVTDAVLFYADDASCSSVLDEWCPNVNFFESSGEARRWADQNGVTGTVIGLGEAAQQGAREWAPLVAAPPIGVEERAGQSG